jgi:hypothetical protein
MSSLITAAEGLNQIHPAGFIGNGLGFSLDSVLPVYGVSPSKVEYGPTNVPGGYQGSPQTIYYGFKPVATPYGNISSSNDLGSSYSFNVKRYGPPSLRGEGKHNARSVFKLKRKSHEMDYESKRSSKYNF